MNPEQAGLFDLPDREPPAAPERMRGGRNRETWTRTATAEVTIVDEQALREAAALAQGHAFLIGLDLDRAGAPGIVYPQIKAPYLPPATSVFDSLAGLIWPTDGMKGPLEAGAFRLLSVVSEVVAESTERGRLTWTVTVKLTDVNALRRLATQAHPAEAASIAANLPVAWQYAADPFAPLNSVPGTTWRPGRVDVQHLPRRGDRETPAATHRRLGPR